MMMSQDPAHCCLLHLRKKKPGDHDEPFGSLLSFALEEKNVKNDNELGGSLASSTTFKKKPRMTMSILAKE
jgi:hypothetical protein